MATKEITKKGNVERRKKRGLYPTRTASIITDPGTIEKSFSWLFLPKYRGKTAKNFNWGEPPRPISNLLRVKRQKKRVYKSGKGVYSLDKAVEQEG